MVSKFTQKIYFSFHTLKIIHIWYSNIFSIQFWYKIFLFFIFLVFSLRGKRERSPNYDDREGEISLTPI
jgi:hypothetical protein